MTSIRTRSRRHTRLAFVALALAWLGARDLAAQESFRVGLSIGGTGFVGVVAEKLWNDRSVELLVTTFSFHDLSVSAVGKQYFGAAWLKPSVGAGLWWMTGRTPDGIGSALIARFPFGADWKISGPSHVTLEVNATRGLLVHRPDPDDDYPMSRRFIPIPAVAYRVSFDQ